MLLTKKTIAKSRHESKMTALRYTIESDIMDYTIYRITEWDQDCLNDDDDTSPLVRPGSLYRKLI